MKKCHKCGKEKPEQEFRLRKGKTNNQSPYLNSECILCEKAWKRKYRTENKERIARERKEYRKKYPEKGKSQRAKEYYSKNSNLIKKRVNEYRKNNKAQISENRKAAYSRNLQKWREYNNRRYRFNADQVTEAYAAMLLRSQGHPNKDIKANPDLVEIKRIQIKIERYAKEKTSKKPKRIALQNGGKIRRPGKR